MHKRIKHLIKNIKDVFDIDEINKIARDTKFVQRKSNITAKDFLAFNVFHGADICSAPLSQLASRYDVVYDTQVSKQALDKRFNGNAVKFIQEIFNRMMLSQNSTLKDLETVLNLHFNRVIVNDSTGFALPKKFKKEFPGSGGSGSTSSIKIQLQYELLSSSFMRIDIYPGTKSDAEYLKTM
ncbi:MAG: transposase, partial [Peptostreptococcaceae bacterium]